LGGRDSYTDATDLTQISTDEGDCMPKASRWEIFTQISTEFRGMGQEMVTSDATDCRHKNEIPRMKFEHDIHDGKR
jgi:hypothetical protein